MEEFGGWIIHNAQSFFTELIFSLERSSAAHHYHQEYINNN